MHSLRPKLSTGHPNFQNRLRPCNKRHSDSTPLFLPLLEPKFHFLSRRKGECFVVSTGFESLEGSNSNNGVGGSKRTPNKDNLQH